MSTSLIGVIAAEAPLCLYDFGKTTGRSTPDVMGRIPLTWTLAPTLTAAADTGPGALGYVTSVAGCYAQAADNDMLPSGSRSFGVEMLMMLKPGTTGSTFWFWGHRGTNGQQSIGYVDAGFPGFGVWGGDWRFDGASTLTPLQFVHVWWQYDALAQTMTCYVNGVSAGTKSITGMSMAVDSPFSVFYSPAPAESITVDASVALLAVHLSRISAAALAARIATRMDLINKAHRLAGSAILDTGLAATSVRVRRVTDGVSLATISPANDGSWSLFVPPGDYEVLALGPSGYRPVCDSPVTAVAT